MKYQDLLPRKKRPIVLIGAGSIVNDAHLPAYKMASFEVAGIFDINIERAKMIAEKFAIPVVYESLEQLIQQAPGNAVFDMALPASAIIPSLIKLVEEKCTPRLSLICPLCLRFGYARPADVNAQRVATTIHLVDATLA